MPAVKVAPIAPIAADDAARNNQMAGHHNAKQASRMIRDVKGEMYGLEMEVYCNDGNRRVLPVANDAEDKFFVDMEPDGSLDGHHGIELITRGPVPVDDLINDGGWLDTWLTKVCERGTVKKGKQPQGYGLHINVNCGGWGWTEKQAYCAAITLMPNINKAAAGRNAGGSDFNCVVRTAINGDGRQREGWGQDERPYGYVDRDANCYVRVAKGNNIDCMEVRMFQMNTDFAVMKGYLNHMREIRKFSKKYKTIILYLQAATRYCRHRWGGGNNEEIFVGGFTTINRYLEDLWANRATRTANEAVRMLPAINPAAIPLLRGVHYRAIFDPQKSFRKRKEALYDAWYSPQQADQAAHRSS